MVGLDELPSELRTARVATRPVKERRRTVADELYTRVVEQRESFWTAVYPRYMNREITKVDVRNLVGKGLDEARGNYKIVARFNMESRDYKKFLNFLRKHECGAVQRLPMMVNCFVSSVTVAILAVAAPFAAAQTAPATPCQTAAAGAAGRRRAPGDWAGIQPPRLHHRSRRVLHRVLARRT